MLCLNVIDMSLTQYIFIVCVCVDCTVVCFPLFQLGRLQKQKAHPNQHWSQLRKKKTTLVCRVTLGFKLPSSVIMIGSDGSPYYRTGNIWFLLGQLLYVFHQARCVARLCWNSRSERGPVSWMLQICLQVMMRMRRQAVAVWWKPGTSSDIILPITPGLSV